jgi:hypothetical protein
MLTPGEIRELREMGERSVRALQEFGAALAAVYEQACANDPGTAAEVEWERIHGTRGWLDVVADRGARGGAGRPPC